MATKTEMINSLVPYFIGKNPDRTIIEIRNYVTGLSEQVLEDTYNSVVPLDPQTEAQIERSADRAVLLTQIDRKNQQKSEQHRTNARAQFKLIAQQLGISNSDVNFNMAYGSLHPSTFNAEDIQQFISDGRLTFLPASPDELAETELIEKQKIVDAVVSSVKGHLVKSVTGIDQKHFPFDVFGQNSPGETPQQTRQRQIQVLLSLSVDRLRQLQQREFGQPVTQPAPVDPNLNSGSGLDQHSVPVGGSYPPLPKTTPRGEPITAQFLVRVANESFSDYKEKYVRRYGFAQLNNRIRGLD